MQRNRFAPDRGLTTRMVVTMFLIGLLYVVFVGALLALLRGAWPLILIIAAAMFVAQFWFSDRIAAYSMGAREVTPEQAPELHGVVDRICALGNLPKPKVAIAETDVPNAFATGRNQKNTMVCATTGLLRRLGPEELEGVIAHELSHVAHKDVAVMTIASFLGVLAGTITRIALWSGMGRRDNRDPNTAILFIVIPLVSAVVYAISFLLTRLLSRYRELSADRAAAYLTGRPSALASALTKVSGQIAAIPTEDLRRSQPFNAFFFAPALGAGAVTSKLLSTHPTLERRLEQLADITRELDRALMGLLDVLLGRSKPVRPDLDQLFGLSSAAITLEAASELRPTGLGSVCFAAVEGGAFAEAQQGLHALLPLETSQDSYGYTWLLSRHAPEETTDLVTDLHAVNSTLEQNGFGPQLLCSLVAFKDPAGRSMALVYLYKRGTFYPFCPLPGEKRDSALELQVKALVANDLRLEEDLSRWFPVWGAPGLGD